MHTLLSRRMTTGLALLVALAFSLTLSGVIHMAAHATPATASITLSKVTGPPTTTLTVKGSDFGRGETVSITFDTTTIVGSTTTSQMGSFSLDITIPATALPGRHRIQAKGQSRRLTDMRTFQVNTNWSQFGYDQAHSRTNPYENVLSRDNVSRLTLDWRYPSGSNIFSSPTVTNGVAYFGSSDSKVYALDARTGSRLWSYTTGSFIESSPAVANGVVYIGSYDDKVYALDARTGTKLWSYTTGGFIESSPAVAHGVVYIGSTDSNVYALDARAGTRLWSYTTRSFLFSSPVVANGIVYITSLDDNMYAFHLRGTRS